jgi:hypothetical protein
MTTPMLMTEHPTEELLAAFVDDRLDSATRKPVTEHLASCGECREIVLMSTEYQVEEELVAPVVSDNLPVRLGDAALGNSAVTVYDRGALATSSGETLVVMANPDRHVSVRGTFALRRRIAAIGGLAAAAAIAVMVVQPTSLFGPDVDDLIEASRTLKVRPSAGRFAGGFAHNAEPSNMRGGPKKEEDFGAKAKLLQYRVDLEEKRFPAPDPHVVGLTRLLTAEKGAKDVSSAVTLLESAYRETRGERDSIAIDLAAALIAYARWSGNPDQNDARALELSNDVLKRQPKSPEALWNRAIALESLNRDTEALRAWDDYLKVDSAPDSPWAQEAAQHKSRITSGF